MKINRYYLTIGVLLFCIEVFIALFVRDAFIRPIFGDFLAVIFLYSLLKSVFNQSVFALAFASLLVAYFLEILQFFQFLKITNLEQYHLLKILIGSSFSWGDLLAYTLGFIFILVIEKMFNPKKI
jgi:Protein of unknown function (DUF2809)